MNTKNILGHINCPTCGTAGAMQITHDKNGHPFGFCAQECGQQLRVGPNPDRIAEFVKRYPFAGTAKAAAPVPAPAPAAAKLAPVPARTIMNARRLLPSRYSMTLEKQKEAT